MAIKEMIKKEHYKELKGKFKSLGKSFNKELDRAIKMEEQKLAYFTSPEIEKYNKRKTKNRKEYEGDFYENVENALFSAMFKVSRMDIWNDIKNRKLNIEQRIQLTKETETDERFRGFLNRYSKDTFTFEGKTHSLNYWINKYKQGKLSNEDLNYIIKSWKKKPGSKYEQSFYAGRNSHDKSM